MSERTAQPLEAPTGAGHVVLVGLGGLGVRTLEELDRHGEAVVVVIPEGGSQPRYRAIAERLARRIIEGDPTDPVVLRQAGLPGARCIVLTGQHDVENIHVALTARGVDEHLRVVMRTFDEELGARVQSLLPDLVALSSSAIAAPGFVSAILGDDEEPEIDVLGRRLAIREASADDPGVLAVLADLGTAPVTLFPADGSRPLCLVDDAGAAARQVTARPRARRVPSLPAPRASWLRRVDRRFWVLAAVILALVLLSALVFERATGVDPFEAVYSAVQTIFGAGDDRLFSTTELRLLAVVLTVLGAALVAVFYGLIADLILSTRLRDILGPQAADARDHVVVVGLGSIGYRVAAALRERGLAVVAAEKDVTGRFVEAARQLGVAVVATDARDPATLRLVRVDRARALVAATDDDAANLATALHARAARPVMPIVVRLFDPELAARLERALGGYESRSVSALAAPAFAAAAIGREVLASVPIGAERLAVVARVPVEPGSSAEGSTMAGEERAAAAVARGGGRILAVVRGADVHWKPSPDESLTAGQELIVAATRAGLAALLARGLRAPARR